MAPLLIHKHNQARSFHAATMEFFLLSERIVSLGISTLGSLSFTLPGNISVAVVGSYVQRQILYDVGRGTINQLPVAVCARERS